MHKKHYVHHKKLVATPEDVHSLALKLKDQKYIAIDTKFIRERTFFPVVALIQVGTEEESWLVDPLALTPGDLKPFMDVLKNNQILKIMHAAQADQECFYTGYGVLAQPSFDTAVGASLCGYGESPGLSKLTKEILGISLAKGHSRTDWTVRPLPDQLGKYAHQDVEHLIAMYLKLCEKLEKKHRLSWAMELSQKYEDRKMFEPEPEEIARRIVKNKSIDQKGYVTLIELIRWREKRVRNLDVPRKWVADDDLLAALSNVRPMDLKHLSAFRGLNKGELKHSGQDILNAIEIASQIPEKSLPAVPQFDSAENEELRAMEILTCFFKIMADQHEIAPKFLVNNDGLLHMIRNKAHSKEEWVANGILTQGAAELLGDELLNFLNGKCALVFKNHQPKLVSL